MMGMQAKAFRHDLLKPQFDRERRLARRERNAVRNAKEMGINRDRRLAESHVEHDIGGFSPNAGQLL